jgi:hypothetical protein
VDVHEVEIEEEGIGGIVGLQQPGRLLQDALSMGPDRGAAQLADLAPRPRKDVAVEAIVEAEGLLEPAVALHAVGAVAGLPEHTGQRDGLLGESVVGQADAVALGPE